jgi:hypothetical protein
MKNYYLLFFVFALTVLLVPNLHVNAMEMMDDTMKDNMMEKMASPRIQMKMGVDVHHIQCKSGHELVFKSTNWSPACVKSSSVARLVEIGWASSHMPSHPDLNDITIKLERTACFGTCPIYSVSIYGNGTIHYEGIRFVETNGTKTYEISTEKIKELVSLVYETGYFSLDDRYEIQVTDLPSAITTITIGNQTKSVYDYGGAGPEKLQNLEEKIDEIAQSYNLVNPETG